MLEVNMTTITSERVVPGMLGNWVVNWRNCCNSVSASGNTISAPASTYALVRLSADSIPRKPQLVT